MGKKRKSKKRSATKVAPDASTPRKRRLKRLRLPGDGTWWMWLPVVIVLSWYAVLYVRQAVYRVPVPNRVLGGETIKANKLMLGWAPDHVESRQLEVQVSSQRNFSVIEYAYTVPNAQKRVVVRPIPEPGVYYWRMRSIIDGKKSPWTRRIRFRVVD